LTKQTLGLVKARQADARITSDDAVRDAVRDLLLEHFNKRWGQGALVSDAEARLVASEILDRLKTMGQMP
jgi:hypothetical protein